MAKEEVIKKVIVSVTLNSDKIEVSPKRNSTGEVTLKSSQSFLSSDDKPLPRYLRPPESSCHDLCKFGKKNVDGTKNRDPNLRRNSTRINIRRDKRAQVSTPLERKQWPELKLKNTTVHTKYETCDKPGDKQSFRASECTKFQTPSAENEQSHEELENSETTNLQSCLSIEKRIISHEPLAPLVRSEGSSSGSASMELESPFNIQIPIDQLESIAPADQPAMSESMVLHSERKIVKSMISPVTKKSTATTDQIPMKSSKTGISSKDELSDRGKAIRKRSIELSEKTATLGRPKSSENKGSITDKKVISVSPRDIKQKSSVNNIKRIEAPTQTSSSLHTRTPSVISTSSIETNNVKSIINKLKPSSSFKSSNPRIDGEKTSLNLRNHRSPKISSSPVKKSPGSDEKVEERTLYVVDSNPVKMEPNTTKKEYRRRSRSSSQSSSFSSSASSSFESALSRVSELVKKKSRTPKLSSAQTMKFRRGKVVSPDSVSYAPRKLKLRQVKGEVMKNNKEVKRRVLRKRRGSGGSASELSTPRRSEAPAVVLRHQDVSEKKDAPTLNYNDVIEETASKLVETRKSKVMALVGAFESIISLQ